MTAKRRIRIKKYRQLLERNNKRTFKVLSNVFLKFGTDVEKDLTKLDILKEISWAELRKRIKNGLKLSIKTTIDSVSEASDLVMDVDLKRKEISAIKNASLKRYNTTVDNRIKGMVETTRKQISLVVDEGQRLGLNKRTIANNIASKFKEISKGRAKTIARTETSKATSITTNETARQSQLEYKIWVHTGSGATDRQTHVDLGGTKSKIDEAFDVSGFDGQFPHDPDLPVSEIVNCGCLCIYE